MRRNIKYGTNKTLRYCKECADESLNRHSSAKVSMNKRDRWKLIDLLRKYSQSPNNDNKIIVQGNHHFVQYNGYQWSSTRKTTPPKHPSFASRPDFVYQPYVRFMKVNEDVFNLALHYGSHFLEDPKNLEQLLDISSFDISVTLIYFLNGSAHCFSSDWFNALKHAMGGYLADYCMVCSGDYCPFGPKLRGQILKDARVNQILFFSVQNERKEQQGCCFNVTWSRPTSADRHDCKIERSRKKIQRSQSFKLTKQAIESRNLY